MSQTYDKQESQTFQRRQTLRRIQSHAPNDERVELRVSIHRKIRAERRQSTPSEPRIKSTLGMAEDRNHVNDRAYLSDFSLRFGRFDPRSHFLLSTKPSIQCMSSRALRWNRCHELVCKGLFSFSLVKFSSSFTSSRSLEKPR